MSISPFPVQVDDVLRSPLARSPCNAKEVAADFRWIVSINLGENVDAVWNDDGDRPYAVSED
jgi:hypothetical protein